LVTCLSTGQTRQLVVLDACDTFTPWGVCGLHHSSPSGDWDHDPGFCGGERPILTWLGKSWAGVSWWRRDGFRQATPEEVAAYKLAQLQAGGL
jgi:hypothetical protein